MYNFMKPVGVRRGHPVTRVTGRKGRMGRKNFCGKRHSLFKGRPVDLFRNTEFNRLIRQAGGYRKRPLHLAKRVDNEVFKLKLFNSSVLP